jgi:3-methyladenine DNA glycosylase AlkD
MLGEPRKELLSFANPERVIVMQRYFRTGPGQYGEGDVFLGVSMPDVRKIAKKHSHISLNELKKLLHSKIHEERMLALLILVNKSIDDPAGIARFYLKNISQVNNWDLVDISAPKILGQYLLDREDRSIIYSLSKSSNLWKRRASILTTFAFIRTGEFEDTFKLAEKLMHDKHDLMHKAIGWMLREVGKYDMTAEQRFLDKHYKGMPRTMLRYAIEKFPEYKRRQYLDGKA